MKLKKKCSKCQKTKAYNDFHIDNKSSTGLTSRCKECRKGQQRNYIPRPNVISPTGKRLTTLYRKGKKECSVCKKVMKLNNFKKLYEIKNYAGYDKMCKPCSTEYRRKWSLRRNLPIREFLYELRITKGCYECGEKDPRVLEFDHLRDKKFNLGKAHILSGITLDDVKREVKKCVIRCSNCHRRKTHKEQRTWVSEMYSQRNASV